MLCKGVFPCQLYSTFKAQHLISRSLQTNQVQYIKSLQDIDHQLYSLFKKVTAFDFVSQVERGTSLFVGEGNLSFAHCIAENVKIPQHIIATTFETEAELSERAVHHKKLLKKRASSVIHGIDALKLHAIFAGAL